MKKILFIIAMLIAIITMGCGNSSNTATTTKHTCSLSDSDIEMKAVDAGIMTEDYAQTVEVSIDSKTASMIGEFDNEECSWVMFSDIYTNKQYWLIHGSPDGKVATEDDDEYPVNYLSRYFDEKPDMGKDTIVITCYGGRLPSATTTQGFKVSSAFKKGKGRNVNFHNVFSTTDPNVFIFRAYPGGMKPPTIDELRKFIESVPDEN